MSEFSQLPAAQRVSGHASFLHRGTPWWQQLQILLADTVMASIGALLWLGGRPLRRLLVRGLSGLAYRLMRSKQRISRINLDLAYQGKLDEAEKQRIIRGMYTHFARGLLDLLFDWVYWPPRKISRYVSAESRQRLAELQAMPGGKSLVSCHLGNPDLALKLVSAVDFDTYVMYKGFKSPWFDRYIARKRLRAGSGLIEVPASRHKVEGGKRVSTGRMSIREEIDNLFDAGHCVGFLADQYATRGGLPMTVLGVPDTPTQAGAWRYVVERGVPFLLVVATYTEDGGLDWQCSEIMEIEDQGDFDTTLRHTIDRANAWFETLIRKHPEQYFWGHRRFARHHYA